MHDAHNREVLLYHPGVFWLSGTRWSKMGRFFDRGLPLKNRYDDLLDTLIHHPSSDSGWRAIAVNFRADHRVTEERQTRFEARLPPGDEVLTAAQFQSAIKKYFEEAVRTAESPDFFHSSNHINLVYGEPEPAGLSGDTELVTCLDLTGLDKVLVGRKSAGNSYFMDYPNATEDSEQVREWHGERLLGGNPGAHIEKILDGLWGHISGGNRHHPTWATLWEPFHKQLAEERLPAEVLPNRWKELCGIGNYHRPDRWVAVLRYSVREAGTLLRPTVLDAGWYSFHFPSPRGLEVSTGGHPMDLRVEVPPVALFREFIHQQIRFLPEHWTGDFGVTALRPESTEDFFRGRHYKVLVDTYGSLVTGWLQDPNYYETSGGASPATAP